MRRVYQAVTAAFLVFCAARPIFWGPGGAAGILTFVPLALWAGASWFAVAMARYDDHQWRDEGCPRGYSYGPAYAGALFAVAVSCLQFAAGGALNGALWLFLGGYYVYWAGIRHSAYQIRRRAVVDLRTSR